MAPLLLVEAIVRGALTSCVAFKFS
uniref:Uncharacterized protein n=1 Tax=Rhodnius prolixus TaxID=13249 RepID=T1IDJ1_RHOPR